MQRHRRPRVLDDWGLPTPYPDELSISVVGRYLKRWEHFDHKQMVVIGLGLGTRVANLTSFPLKVSENDALYRFNAPSGLVARKAIWELTLAPYYLAFQHAANVEATLRALESRAVFTSFTWLAMPDRPNFLRFCPACFKEESSSHGEPYWHRSHQLPYAMTCEIHGCHLADSKIEYYGRRWHQSRPPERKNCPDESPTTCTTTFHAPLMAFVQDESLRALRRSALTYNFISKHGFRKLLQNMGYRSGQNLQAELLEEHFRIWLQQNGASLENLGRRKWWLALFTAVGRPPTPAQVILFRRFLRDVWSKNVSQMRLDLGH